MSNRDTDLKNPETQKRLALLALAAQRRESTHTCPDDEHFALLLEADPGSAEQQRFFDHLSVCESCREKWLVLSDELGPGSDRRDKTGFLHGRRGLLSLMGSACAVAVGVMLYLSIDYHPGLYEDDVSQAPANQDQVPAAETVRVDRFKKEAEAEKMVETDAGQVVSEPKRYRREAQMEKTATVKTSPAPQMSEPPAEQRGVEQALSDRQSFSVASGAARQPVQFEEFIESLLTYCKDRKEGISRAEWSVGMLEQGKELLEREETIARDKKAMIDNIIQLLSRSEPVKDTELHELCEKAGHMAAKTDHAPR